MKQIFFLFIALFNLSLFAVSEFETGLKFGPGFKSQDQFENGLRSYKSNLSPDVYNHTTLDPARNFTFTELFFKRRIISTHKIGFAAGAVKFKPFSLREFNTAPEYTHIDFNLNSVFFMGTYSYEYLFRRIRNLSIEGTIGMGVNHSDLLLKGYGLSPFGYSEIKGNLSGSGLQFKLEGSVNKQFSDNFKLQLGLLTGMTAIASFDGNLGNSTGSLYVRGDGTVAQMTQEQFNSYTISNLNYSRKLDMKIAFTVVYLAGVLLF